MHGDLIGRVDQLDSALLAPGLLQQRTDSLRTAEQTDGQIIMRAQRGKTPPDNRPRRVVPAHGVHGNDDLLHM